MAEREREREREREHESYFNPTDDLREKLIELAKENAHLRSQLSKQRYGLVWLDVPEEFEKESEDRIPILEEVPEKEIRTDDGKPCHILIEGENYHALTCLNYTHRGKVDVIYIDPPYNTGSDGFKYRDKRFSTEFPNGVPVPKDSPFRHSYWLSFMAKRLELAKNLLSDRGVIFISIDDNEQANLKLLCDQVFGENNFAATFPWRKRTAKADVPFSLSQDYEWILCYANAKFRAGVRNESRKYYQTPDLPNRPWRVHDLTKQTTAKERPNSFFTIVNPRDGKEYPANPQRTWAITDETFHQYYEQNRIVFPGDYDFLKISKPVLRYFQEDDVKKAGKFFGFTTASTNFPKEVGMTQDGTKDLDELFDEKVFSFPKPTSLLSWLIQLATPLGDDVCILDFFAGSGTTLHAVMKLNEEDGGNRQCILVQLDENGICENVTYERNRRVMQGYENPKGEQVPGLGNSLKYYRTAFVGKNPPARALDADRIELACKAGYLLAMGENTLFEQTRTETFQIFADSAEKKRVTAIYFEMDIEGLDEFERQVKEYARTAEKVSAYLFSWSNGEEFESMFEEMPNIEVKSIPQPILEIYRTIQK